MKRASSIYTGGWFILRDWNTWDFEYKKILKQLHVKYGVTPYFKISVVPNPRIPGNSSIAISPAGLGLPDRSYYYAPQNDTIISAYKQLIRDVVIHLSAPKADAEKFGNDIFYYEQRIAEITPESNELLDPINTYNPIKLSELKLTATSLPLHDILTAMFPSANIDDDTEIIVTSPDYLLKVSEIISSTDHKNLNSYMIWMLVKEFLPYLSSRFTSANDAFYSELLGISQPYQRWEFCTNLVQKFMAVAVDTLLERANPIEEATKRVINSTFVTLKNVVKRRLNKYNSIPLLYSRLEKKLLNMKLQIGLPLDTHNDTILKNYYNKLFVLKANLFESYKNGILFLKKVEESRLMENRGADYIINYAVQNPFKIRYSQSTNTVIVPRAVLTTPNFENRYPKSIIYGRLGVDIANAIVSSVLPFASAWTSEGKLLTPFHQSINESSRLIRHSRQCLTNFVANDKLAALTEAHLTSLHSFIYLSSLNTAIEGLHVSLETDTHVHQPSLETYEDSALFYLSHIQNYCSISTKQQDFYDNLIRFQLSEKSLLKLAWSQHQSMSESLDCSARTEKICSDIF